jgi:hypothetical protein
VAVAAGSAVGFQELGGGSGASHGKATERVAWQSVVILRWRVRCSEGRLDVMYACSHPSYPCCAPPTVVAIGGGADPLRLEGFWKDGWLRWDVMLRADGTDAGLIFSLIPETQDK